MMIPIDMILASFLCSVAAVCYHAILIMPGKPLSGFHYSLKRGEKALRHSRFYDAYTLITHSIRECSWCLAGQLAAVYFILSTPLPTFTDGPWHFLHIATLYLFHLLFTITLAIIITPFALNYTLNAIEKQSDQSA